MVALKDTASGEYFDIPSDISLEIERGNPYLGTDEISGENTLPINIFYTDKNYRLINYHGNFYKRNQKINIEVEIYDNTNYKYTGTFVIQQHTSNMNAIANTIWVGIVTFNSSAFFQEAKNKFLHQIDLGGARSFPWTTGVPGDSSGGFWQHIHAARTPDAFDYTFYPISNPSWEPYIFTFDQIIPKLGMNMLGPGNVFHHPDSAALVNIYNIRSIVPMIYVSYILKQVFKAIGWNLTGDVLNDPGFKKLTLVGTRSIHYKIMGYPIITLYPVNPVVFDLKDFVTEGVTLYKFMIDLKNRFGWKFLFDSNTKTATLSSLKSGINAGATDWTKYVVSDYQAGYKEVVQSFSLINNVDGNDGFPLNGDTNRLIKIPPAASFAALPVPATQPDNVICFAFKENTWYMNEKNYASGINTWEVFSHNIDNYIEPDPSTKIETDISTMPTLKRTMMGDGADTWVPVCDYVGNNVYFLKEYTNLGMRMLFYHGMKNDSAGVPYPYASCHSSDQAGNDNLTPWSISYRREYGSINNGVYDYWYKAWLEYIKSDDIRTFRFNLPLYVLSQFNWETCIRINDVDFVPVSYKEILPYPGMIEFKMKRVN